MELKELALLVQNMRDAQKGYFKNRTLSELQESKALEKQLDDAVHEILNPKSQTKMF